VKHVDFFYDFACPYAYLAHHRVDAAGARHGATVAWRPFLLGGVFRAIGTPDMPAAHMPAAKARLNLLDMHRWAAFFEVPFRMPETHPNRTVLALRAALASSDLVRASKALFAAYWAHGLDVSRPEVVRATLDRVGLDGAALVARAEAPEVKDALRRATDQAIAAGVFGAPSFVVTIRNEPGREDVVELLWGQDRLQLVEALLSGASPTRREGSVSEWGAANERREASVLRATGTTAASPTRREGSVSEWGAANERREASVLRATGTTAASSQGDPDPQRVVELHFDFSSPFAYLAAARIEEVAARSGAAVLYRPFLLGGLFQAIGTPNVPLFEMPEPKRLHSLADMRRWAAHFDVTFAFPSRFPMSTVKPLRMVLALPEAERGPLVRAVFRAYWADDRDISDVAVLRDIATSVGLDGGALVARTSDASLKTALREATDEAARRGVFGAPTFFVEGLAFWGQDRLDLVEKALGGWRPPGE